MPELVSLPHSQEGQAEPRHLYWKESAVDAPTVVSVLTACRGPRNPTVSKFRTNELAQSFDSCKLGICITETQKLQIVYFSMRERQRQRENVWSVCRCTYNNANTTYTNTTLGVVPQVLPGSLTGWISDLARLASQQVQISRDSPWSLQCWD